MFKFVNLLHLQNRCEKHAKIDDANYKYQIKHTHNNKTHNSIKKFLHKTSEANAHTSKENSPLVSCLKFDNAELHAAASPADAAPVAATAWRCCQSDAREFCRCSGDDRCTAGAPCTTTRCCCCCSAQCSSARLWRTSTLPGCCCATAARRFPFCRLSTGICPIRQQLQWAHGAALSRLSASDCPDCRSSTGLADCQQENYFCSSKCCTATSAINRGNASSNNTCYECCHNEMLQPVLKKQLPITTTSKLSAPSTKPSSLAPFKMKLRLLTDAATNCC